MNKTGIPVRCLIKLLFKINSADLQGNNIRGPAAEAVGKMLRHNKSILR